MMHLLLPRLLADVPKLTLAPVLSLWLVIPALAAAVILTVILYRSQRLMASRRMVLVLTAIRAILIAMIGILFLQPAMQWTLTHTSAGTLWLVTDQSPSMATTDPQATDLERLRWARGIGLIETPKNSAEALAAQVHALAGEYRDLAPIPEPGGTERVEIRAFSDRISAWVKEVQKLSHDADNLRSELNGDAAGAGDRAVDDLSAAASAGAEDASNARAADSLQSAAAGLRTSQIIPELTSAQVMLEAAATGAQRRFLFQNAAGSAWKTAQEHVSTLSRDQLAYETLAGGEAPAAHDLEKLASQYHLRIASFSEKTQPAGTVDPASLSGTLQTALTPGGTATDLAGALQYVAEQTSAEESASVIVVTDGRSNVGNDPTAAARSLSARGVHVYGLLAGSHEVSPDAAVQPVDFPEWIFKGDSVKARAAIRMDGLKGKTAMVELRRGNLVLQRHEMLAPSNHEVIPFDFTDTPPESDKAVDYEIRVEPLPGEVNTQNNVAAFRVAIKKDKLYALYIEDRPRWEYRYLATLISRRPGMRLQTVLLQPGTVAGVSGPPPVMASPDNPHEEAQILPDTLAGWEKFDVIVIGDVSPDTLTPRMQQFITTAVRDKGAALITIAGQRFMPAAYVGLPLAELLPVTLEPQWTPDEIERHTHLGFRPDSAPTAGFSALVQLANDPTGNANAWSGMPAWYWHSPFTQIKPAATALWTINEIGRGGGGGGGGPPWMRRP